MLPFDFGHRQQAVHKFLMPCARCKSCGSFILFDVAPLQFPCTIHGREPARQVTEHAESAANQESSDFTKAARLSAKLGEHLTDEAAMMPLLIFNLMNSRSRPSIADRAPMPAISIRGSQLARIGQPQNVDQIFELLIVHG